MLLPNMVLEELAELPRGSPKPPEKAKHDLLLNMVQYYVAGQEQTGAAHSPRRLSGFSSLSVFTPCSFLSSFISTILIALDT
jgi:hypothetical protein